MIHNRPIYHCQCCGAVVRQERFQVPPFCCSQEMTMAGEETLRDDFAHEWNPEPIAFDDSRLAPHWSVHEAEYVST